MTDTAHPFPSLSLGALARNWWLILLRGITAIAFGILTFSLPSTFGIPTSFVLLSVTLVALAVLYSAFAFLDGAFALWAGIAGGSPASRWWLILVGLLGIAAGIVTAVLPWVTTFLVLFIIAFWAIATGVVQIIGAIWLRKEIDNEWLLIAAGVVSILFGAIMLAAPGAGAGAGVLAILFVIGVYAIVYGVILVGFAIRLRKHAS